MTGWEPTQLAGESLHPESGGFALGLFAFFGGLSVFCLSIHVWLLYLLPTSTGKVRGRVGSRLIWQTLSILPLMGALHLICTVRIPFLHQSLTRILQVRSTLSSWIPSHVWILLHLCLPCFLTITCPAFCLPETCYNLSLIDVKFSSFLWRCGFIHLIPLLLFYEVSGVRGDKCVPPSWIEVRIWIC